MMDTLIGLFSERFSSAITWTLVHSLWQASLISLIMSLYLKRYQKESSVVRYRISMASLLMVFFCALATFTYYYTSYSPAKEIYIVRSGAEIIVESPTSWAATNQGFIDSIGEFLIMHFDIIALTWFLGAVLFSFRILGAYVYVSELKKSHNYGIPNWLYEIFEDIKERIQINKEVQLIHTHKVETPMTVGFFKPVILLPIGVINQLDLNEVEAILAHELAHIDRNDFMINIIQSFIETIFYYHPAVWWISANIRTERENCCDDFAISLCGNPMDYAKALVKIQEMKIETIPSLAIPFANKGYSLFNRVSRILNQPQNKSQIREKLAATILLFSAIVCFASGNNKIHKKINFDFAIAETHLEPADEKIIVEPTVEKIVIEPIIHLAEIQDTIPIKKKEKVIVEKEEGDKVIEIKIEDGKVLELKIDGEIIPQDEIKNYRNYYDEYLDHLKPYSGYYFGNGGDGVFLNLDSMVNPGKWDYLFQFDQNNKWNFDSSYWKNFSDQMKDYSLLWKDQMKDNKFWTDSLWNKDQMEMAKKGYREALKSLEQNHYWLKDFSDSVKIWTPEVGEFMKIDSLLNHSYQILGDSSFQFDFQNWAKEWNENKQFWTDSMGHWENLFQENFNFGDNFRGLYFGGKAGDVLINEMWKDGLLKEGQPNKVELSGKYLKINGENQSQDVWEKYKNLYEDRAGHEMTEDSKIEFDISGDRKESGSKLKRI